MRPTYSPTKKIEEYHKNNNFVFKPYEVVILSIFITLIFGYILKYFNCN